MMTYFSLEMCVALIIFVLGAWLPPKKQQPLVMALITAAFMAIYAPLSLGLLAATTLLVYYLTGRRQPGTPAVIAAITLIGLLLVVYKLRATFSDGALLIPLGLSYYAFRQIHYIFEAYKNRIGKSSLFQLVCYLFFLPTLIVGPIHRYHAFARDQRRRRWDTAKFTYGLERILSGYLKVTILANYMVNRLLANAVKAYDGNGLMQLYLDSVLSWADLYLQFSGYSDIAIGVAALAGFEIMENFKFPFLAENIKDFWGRWHISLTSWCREYVFHPMLSFSRRPFLSVALTMLILGLWHEVSTRYILWGIYHAVGISVWHQFQKLKPAQGKTESLYLKLPGRALATLITLNFVILSYPVTSYVHDLLWGRISR